ncbi:26S proteasome regulatory subunit 6A [Metarhizium acridum]|nr:26S proteasome regulatory subunit 6A [Metarhizium acridum]
MEAKLVRDCFALAKEKAPAIIFIDELDAVGTKDIDSEKSGDREVQKNYAGACEPVGWLRIGRPHQSSSRDKPC